MLLVRRVFRSSLYCVSHPCLIFKVRVATTELNHWSELSHAHTVIYKNGLDLKNQSF